MDLKILNAIRSTLTQIRKIKMLVPHTVNSNQTLTFRSLSGFEILIHRPAVKIIRRYPKKAGRDLQVEKTDPSFAVFSSTTSIMADMLREMKSKRVRKLADKK